MVNYRRNYVPADDEDYRKYMDYIHFNPVKQLGQSRDRLAALIVSPHVRQGILSPDWGVGGVKGNMGNDYYIPDSATLHPGYAGFITQLSETVRRPNAGPRKIKHSINKSPDWQ